MKIYFLSSKPAVLTLNGVYFGIVNGFERFADITLSDRVFAQFIPQDGQPVGFFITEELRFSPPPNAELYLLKDGIAVYVNAYPPADLTLKPVAQAQFGEVCVSVYRQGELQISVQSPDGFFNATLPSCFTECTLSEQAGLFFVDGGGALALYNRRAELLLYEKTLGYRVEENRLYATLPLSDSLQRTAECIYELTDNECVRTQFTLRQQGENEREICETLLPYAFFESVLIGADFAQLLAEETRGDADNIRAFLGEFSAVVPTDDPLVCGLVKRKAERLYEVAYYGVRIKNGKITDVLS